MVQITAIIPVFNRTHVVGKAIESVLAQRLPEGCSIETIVVDDGSSDDLASALLPYGRQVTLIQHERNQGAAAARNTGVAAAGEGYVAFLDSDDVWLAGKLSEQIEAMRINRWVASCTAYLLARRNRSTIVSPRYRTGQLGLEDMAWGCFVSPGSTLVVERSLFAEIGPFDTTLKRLEDWDWLLRLARKHPLGFLAKPLARIDPAVQSGPERVLAALELIRQKHLANYSGRERTHFLAGLDVEMAAAFYRNGNYLGALPALLRSLLRSPTHNAALTAILHNRLARN